MATRTLTVHDRDAFGGWLQSKGFAPTIKGDTVIYAPDLGGNKIHVWYDDNVMHADMVGAPGTLWYTVTFDSLTPDAVIKTAITSMMITLAEL